MAAEAFSTSTESSYGGCTFEELCNGSKKYYACDNTADITNTTKIDQARDRIAAHIDRCITAIEIGREKKISKFYIGKTYIHRTKRSRGGHNDIDPKNPNTWKKKGIKDRWDAHSQNDYGRDGLVVVAVVTRSELPPTTVPRMRQQDYTIALEQQLLHEYLFMENERRLVNETFAPGGIDDGGSAAYCIYFAFSL